MQERRSCESLKRVRIIIKCDAHLLWLNVSIKMSCLVTFKCVNKRDVIETPPCLTILAIFNYTLPCISSCSNISKPLKNLGILCSKINQNSDLNLNFYSM